MIVYGMRAVFQPGFFGWQKLFALGFFVCLTVLVIYQFFVTVARPTSALADSATQSFIHGLGSLIFVIGGAFMVSREDATVLQVVGSICSISFFRLCVIVLFRQAKTCWKRR